MKVQKPISPRVNDGWGHRSQIGGTLEELKDLRGNADGVWGNEGAHGHDDGKLDHFLETNPALSRASTAIGAGLSVGDEISTLTAFRAEQEASWGMPVMDPAVQSRMGNGELFAAQKAIALTRLERHPADVEDGFIEARGSVAGRDIAPRELFFQHFKPIGEPSGKVVMISPGFLETGRNFYEQIDAMNKKGHAVVVMDHSWAGQSEGSPGRVESGFDVARDVAAMTAHTAKIARERYGEDAEVVLFGNSMGAGPGVLGALTLNDNGLIDLEGEAMPTGLKALLQAPYLSATPSPTNALLAAAGRLPLLNRLQAPPPGVPNLTDDPIAEHKVAQGAVLEDVRAQLTSMVSAQPDLDYVMSLIDDGKGPKGSLAVVHGREDTLADPEKSEWLARALGDQVSLTRVDTSDHVLEQSPAFQGIALDALSTLIDD